MGATDGGAYDHSGQTNERAREIIESRPLVALNTFTIPRRALFMRGAMGD